MDIGCYPIHLSRFLFGSEPHRVTSSVELHPEYGTDILTSAILDFGSGTSTFTCSTQLVPDQRVQIYGDQGRIEIEIPFNAPPGRPCRAWYQRAGETREELLFETCDQYQVQGEIFSSAVIENLPVPVPISDAVANMRVIEAIFRAGARQSWEPVG